MSPQRTLLKLVGGQERDGPLSQPHKHVAAARLPQQLVALQQVQVAAVGDLGAVGWWVWGCGWGWGVGVGRSVRVVELCKL